jgi:hypothetical protein
MLSIPVGNGNHNVQANIEFYEARPIPEQPDQVQVSMGILPVGSSQLLNLINQPVKLGTPLQVEHQAGGYHLRLLKVEAFTEDTRPNLNSPSPVGYRALLQVEKLAN